MEFKKVIEKVAAKIYVFGSGLSQSETWREKVEKTVTEGMPELLRQVASDGAILLENDGSLPLLKNEEVSVFGRVQVDWFYTGYGSGGDVNKPYAVNLLDAMSSCDDVVVNEDLAKKYRKFSEESKIDHGYWGHWPRFYEEFNLSEEEIKVAASESEKAIYVIGRSSGEDRENALEKGSYFLTDDEIRMLKFLRKHFKKLIVLVNSGSLVDFSWVKKIGINSLMLVWQGGMESGNAVCDLLTGKVSPSGKLPDTIAKSYDKYPSAFCFGGKDKTYYEEDIYVGYRYFETFKKTDVLYPFGFGLSYTNFDIAVIKSSIDGDKNTLKIKVTNIGDTYYGKEVICAYIQKPCGVLGNPYRVLAAFIKTENLAPKQSQELTLNIDKACFASYDEKGKTGFGSAFVVEKGEYIISVGTDVRSAVNCASLNVPTTTVIEQLTQAGAPHEKFNVVTAKFDGENYAASKQGVNLSSLDLRKTILENLPKSIDITGDLGYKLDDVKLGKVSMQQFVAQLSLDELEAISRGDYTMNSKLGVEGNAGVFGGVTQSLRDKGIKPVTTTDGPSGVRLSASCSLLPNGTLIASTFDTKLAQELYFALGNEAKKQGSDVMLAPGINIHRNPLCGRNFEYLSEDPYLTGKIAAALINGVQSAGVSACPKHFACNNQEFNRNENDSVVSERALREIYLKGFEICVKDSKPKNIMTSYNKINGVWGHYQYELCQIILRDQWGYTGNIITDWWMKPSKSPEFPKLKNQAYRVRAGVDVLMPGSQRLSMKKPDGTLLKTYGKTDGITLGEMQRCATNVLNFVMSSK